MAVSEEQFRETMNKLAESVAASITATAALTGSQTNFLRAASSADSNIALSQGTPMLYSEVVDARLIDNTVTDKHRNGLPANKRDTRPEMPSDFVYDPDDDDYDPDDPRHGNDYGRWRPRMGSRSSRQPLNMAQNSRPSHSGSHSDSTCRRLHEPLLITDR